jgi:hypothetical protein
MKQLVGKRIFFHSMRTAIIFVAGFIIYEILLDLEKEWNKRNPGHETYNFHKRNIFKFIFIFLVDFVVLYAFILLFDTVI